ncbi:hypothetical protein [Brevundimonas sp.]|jgi:hypothetical protein|nr:hypothetical protein [Brevundimonas sp.]
MLELSMIMAGCAIVTAAAAALHTIVAVADFHLKARRHRKPD